MANIGILYICTGRYDVFWPEFYASCERHLLPNMGHCIHYFVFTDAESLPFEDKLNVHRIFQESLPWPYITLRRFEIFQKARRQLEDMDFVYFFNANMLILQDIGSDILPDDEHDIVLVKHCGFYDKRESEFTYDRNPKSLAYIPHGEGECYFAGGLNGGTSSAYLEMIDELQDRTARDEANGVIALWHDESHLNRYAIDHKKNIKTIDSSYCYAEGWNLPFPPIVLVRDKRKYGKVSYLRNLYDRKSIFSELLHCMKKILNIYK